MSADGDRGRLGLLLLLAGTLLFLLLAAGYITWERGRLVPGRELTPAEKAELRERVRAPMRLLLASGGLAVGFAVTMYLFLLWSRRYRARLTRSPRPPTPVEDVWSMHRLPDEPPEEGDEPSGRDADT